MDSDSTGSIIILTVLILLSAYFSATETAFSSLNRIRMKSMAENGNKKAQLVVRLNERYDKLLSTILVGNNIVNLSASAIATVLFINLLGGTRGPTVATIVITVVVLIFGEITPKSLAKESPERFAMFSAPILRVLMFALTPVNFIFSLWKKLISKLFKSKDDRSITEEELLTMVEEAELEGAINSEDKDLIYNVIEFNDTKAGDIFTPRVDVVGVSTTASKEEIAETFTDTGYSRIPVYEGSLDRIVGVIHLKDFYNKVWDTDMPASAVIKPTLFIAPSMRINDLLKLLQGKKVHLAVVTDDYGGTAGIVTLEDILEELVGDIWDEHDEVVEEFVKLSDGSYRITCSADIDDMLELFDMEEEDSDASSVGGWVMDELGGKIPEEGDTFEYEGLVIRVSKTDLHRVVEIIVKDTRPEAQCEQPAI
ncbi:hemolysin family protein [Christensenellaceae bacterium OttesenSCG-928-M15]|nr:hemolysin family protein [Christensenellaceae bacterium OttesenSCG-928-M15]